MKIKFLFALLCATAVTANAQDEDCNQEVWPRNFGDPIPQGVCIPQGMFNYITYVHGKTDINGDGLEDFICEWNVRPLNDGDTLYVSVYLQNADSTFSHFRTFVNLYPIYFKSYDLNYTPKDTSLMSLLKKYESSNPFHELSFEKDLITLRIEFATTEDLILTYRFHKEEQDWLYERAEIHSFEEIESIDLSHKVGLSISKFSYFYWNSGKYE
jgi:hypothetical protein